MTKHDIVKALDCLYPSIVLLHDFLTVYGTLKQAIKEHPEKLMIANGFFSTAREALLRGIFIEASKLYDKSAYSIPQILNLCYKWIPESRDDARELRKELKKLNPQIDNLREQRNKYYAHRDKNDFNDLPAVLSDYPISLLEIFDLAKFAAITFNRMHIHLDCKTYLWMHTDTHDLPKLLERIT